VTHGTKIGPPEDLENCLKFVYEGDVPEDISDQISDAGSWSVVRFYDDELPEEEVRAAVLASPAPSSWTTAAANPYDSLFPSNTAATTSASTSSPQSTPSSAGRGSGYHTDYSHTSLKVWAVTALTAIGLVIAL
jgi:hypothetical protein